MSSGQGQRAVSGREGVGRETDANPSPHSSHTHNHRLPRTHKRRGKLDGSARCEQYVAGVCPTPCLTTGGVGSISLQCIIMAACQSQLSH